jgi:geranylgeranyl pyrophosphate synthase
MALPIGHGALADMEAFQESNTPDSSPALSCLGEDTTVARIQTEIANQTKPLPHAGSHSAAIDRKQVPAEPEVRGVIRRECCFASAKMDRSEGISKGLLENEARQILSRLGLSEAYLGWTMVVLSSEFWRDQVAAAPHARRLLLLPPHGDETHPAFGELCEQANELGMTVKTTASSTEIMQVLFTGTIDAIVGVASLDTLEKAIDKILLVGMPALAVPLLTNNEESPMFDADWVQDMLHSGPAVTTAPTHRYLELLQTARSLFEPAELARLLPRQRSGPSLSEVNGAGIAGLDPIAATETIAHDFLALGGKYARPFITLAAYDAISRDEQDGTAVLPDSVRRVALSIETFHKASLVHDDIEDSDDFRYGQPSLHRAHGTPTAINVGDYMIGLGYSLVAREAATLGTDVVGEILDLLSDAHVRLSEGQGAELLWRDARNKLLTPSDALEIYALKTSPAFEAALLSGLRCAGSLQKLATPLKLFCRHLGIAFQIINDLKDWQGDADNKLGVGLDTLGGRPTVLWALALEGLDSVDHEELLSLAESAENSEKKIRRVRELYEKAGVFDCAALLVRNHQQQAESIAQEIAPESLQRLLHYLVEIVLDRAPTVPAGSTLTASMTANGAAS